MNKNHRMVWLILVIGIVLGLGHRQEASAATVTVTNLGDGTANAANCPGTGTSCRLRDAMAKAATGDTINFDVTGTITLTSGQLVINKNLTINGPDAARLTISGNNASRVFNINTGFTVALSGLTIANANSGSTGGGIFNQGVLTLSGVVVTNNIATLGGGIYNSGGSLTIINSTISNNNSTAGDGFIASGGGISSHFGGTLTLMGSTISGNVNNNPNGSLQGAAINMSNTTATLTNCTISGHSASNNTGIIFNQGSSSSGSTLTLINCTVTANKTNGNLTIVTFGGTGSVATTQLRNTLVAGNTGRLNFGLSGNATLTSLGNNLDSDGSSGFTNGVNGNIVGTSGSPINALLAPLANYGGPTNTHALLPGSPAINAGDNCVLTNICASNNLGFNLTTDQRGASFNRQEGSAVEIGAFESRGFTLAVASGNNQSTTINTAFANPLAVTVMSVGGGEPVNGGRVRFTPPPSGASATMAGNPLANGNGLASVDSNGLATSGTVTANATPGSYTVAASAAGASSGVDFSLTNTTPCTPPGISIHPSAQTVYEGASASFSVTATGTGLSYQWFRNGAIISGATESSYTTLATTAGDNGALYSVVVSGACGTATSNNALLTVNPVCVVPVVSMTGPASGAIYAVGTPVNFTGAFTDSSSSGGTHTATWTFDSITQAGAVDESAGTVSASYTFTQAGVYQVTLNVSNSCGEQGVAGSTAMVVVYDPSAGFVTGGGWIVSSAGAYAPNPSLTGNATFGFVSKYKKGSNVPIGETEFRFALANLLFESAAYEWLVVSGARAQFKGSGTINDQGDYRFILTAIDGNLNGGDGQDKFRIRIWNNQGGGLVYDNQLNDPDSAAPTTVIGGGQIVIHTGGNGNNQTALAAQATDEINGEGGLHEAEVEWQIILGDEGRRQSVLRGGSGAPDFDLIAPGDYDGDGQPDLAIFRRASGLWLIKRSSDGGLAQWQWGLGADLPVAADYDGDGKTDLAVWRGATGQWFIRRSSDGAKQVIVWGAGLAPFNDQPAPADYDGDGKADVAVWRAAEGKWYALGSASNSVLTKTGEPPATAIWQ